MFNELSFSGGMEMKGGKVILGLTVSLDGFVEDSNGSVGVLYPDLEVLDNTEDFRESQRTTGSVVMDGKEYAMAEDPDWYAGNYEYQVPIFVLTNEIPKKHPKETDILTFTFVTDGIESAIQQAKRAAGAKDVNIIGSTKTVRECMSAELADELHIDIIPIFLKDGFRPFDEIGNTSIKLKRTKVVELPEGRTRLRFQVIK
jgi:dihydrofolate reductase